MHLLCIFFTKLWNITEILLIFYSIKLGQIEKEQKIFTKLREILLSDQIKTESF